MRTIVALALAGMCLLLLFLRRLEVPASTPVSTTTAQATSNKNGNAGLGVPGLEIGQVKASREPLVSKIAIAAVSAKTGEMLRDFTVLLQASLEEGARSAQPIAFADADGTAVLEASSAYPCLLVAAPMFCVARIAPASPGCKYEARLQPAATQEIILSAPDGQPVVGCDIALACRELSQEGMRQLRAAGKALPHSSLVGISAGDNLFVARTSGSGIASFSGLAPGKYWVYYNTGQLPFVRAGADNPVILEVPSPIVSAVLTPLSGVLLDAVTDEVVACQARLQSVFYQGYDSWDSDCITHVKSAMVAGKSERHAFLGVPLPGRNDEAVKVDICWRHSGWGSAMCNLRRISDAMDATLVRPNEVGKDATVELIIVPKNQQGGRVTGLDGLRCYLQDHEHPAIPVQVGIAQRVPAGRYNLQAGPGTPLAMFGRSETINCNNDAEYDLVVDGQWMRYVVDVSAASHKPTRFGVTFRSDDGVENVGVIGNRWECWSKRDKIEATFFVRGFQEKELVLAWASGKAGPGRSRCFTIEVE